MTAAKNGAGEPALVEAVVAPRRVLQGPGRKTFPAGSTVQLPADEAKRLTALGFLVDPAATEVAAGQGPQFGPSVTPT